jgi:hypothetical protein
MKDQIHMTIQEFIPWDSPHGWVKEKTSVLNLHII